MRIKKGKQKEDKKSSLSNVFCNPESNLCIESRPGVVFQSQFKSIHNYFSLLHHIFGRDVRANQILKDLTKNKSENQNSLQFQITEIVDNDENDTLNTKLMRSTITEIHQLPQRSSSNNQRCDLYRPKWKDSILRRKNNGSHGEIMKGNARENHSRLMNRINLTEVSPEEPRKANEKATKQEFVPIGSVHFNQSNRQSPFKNVIQKHRTTPKPKMKTQKTTRRKVDFKSDKKRWRADNYSQMMSRTCFPLRSSIQTNQNMTIRKSIVTTPYRYKSRMSTPCPWDHTSQR